MASSSSPFQTLADIAKRSIALAAGLPAQDEAVELWNGIGFTIDGVYYVAPMGSVSELLHLPKYTAVPGVKNWMLGVANVRGRLLPIMDLARFFGLNHASAKSREKRVLVIEHGEVLSGFIVDSVLGMQYFPKESFHEVANNSLPPSAQPYVKGAYSKSDVEWHVFDTFSLTEDDKFLDVAVATSR
ncbi:MAG: chemotaxis protein CheW [Oleiphilaceae bacterium]|nr:chemotaxis protein CheW [Oleiphilaceae bacterium]